MTDRSIFCNTPWYELHIYWDGSLGICCQEDHKLYTGDSYNIANTTISKWFNSDPVRQFRLAMLSNQKSSLCNRCYTDENYGGDSRRLRSLQKSAIFAKQAFDASFEQSPGTKHFNYSKLNNGYSITQPIDIHVDLGNYCNLACKMCSAAASSTIAAQQVKWGISDSKKFLGHNWTKNLSVWQSFIDQILKIDKLQNIHFMGGETLLTDRFENLIDQFCAAERYDVCFSFVTNGTVYKNELMQKLGKFKRVGVEISIETTTAHNSYQRQGTDTNLVLANIQRYRQWAASSTGSVSLRPVLSALTIGHYWKLLHYAVENSLLIISNICLNPKFMHPTVLPLEVRSKYVDFYKPFLDHYLEKDYNSTDPHNVLSVIAEQANQAINLLNAKEPQNIETFQAHLVEHCSRWDKIYNLDARSLYPELQTLWDKYAY